MKKAKEKTYYVVMNGGEPVVHGDKLHLFLKKKDASLVKGDVIETVRLARVRKKATPKKRAV